MVKLLLKVSEAGEMIGVGRSRMYEMIYTGDIPSIRIGKSIRIPKRALESWVEERQGSPISNE